MSTKFDSDQNQAKVSNSLGLSSKTVRIASLIAAVMAVINAIAVMSYLVDLRSRVKTDSLVIVQIDPSVFAMHIRITMALLLAAVCLWPRRVAGLLISVVALIWIVIEYGRWYFWSLSIQRESGAVGPGFPQFFGLYGGNTWNVAVIAIVLALLIWEAKILLGSLRPLPH